MLLVLGNACRDITFRVTALPAPGETLNAFDTVSGLGGKGLNQAIAAARTGAVVRFVATVGSDAVAGTIRAALRAENMTDTGLIAKPGETDLSAIIVASSGENMIVTNAAQAASLGIEDIAEHMSFSSGDVLLLHLVAHNELHFSYQGAVTLRDLETGQTLQLDADQQRPAYQQQLQQWLRDTAQAARRQGFDYHQLSTAEPLDQAIREFLRRRNSSG